MYLEFYGLSEKPFSQTPDPRFLYWNDAYRETLASLSYGIRERKGFIAMLGEAGTGKTTLLRKLLDELGDDIVSVFLFNPNATFEEILEYTLSELGITAPSGRKLQMLQRLNEFLLAAYSEGRNTILIIDEAQDLDSDVLESLRLLSNLETADDKILQIVLSGQPEFAEKLADPGLRQLKQRISVRCRLEPLQREELPEYLSARLAVAGGSPDLFDPETFDAIWTFSTGIPRIINSVCDNALLLGYALGKRTIDGGVMQEVITDLRKIDVDSWLPTATPAAPEPAVAQAPAAEPAQIQTVPRSEPARPAGRATRSSNRGGSLGWMVAAVLAGLVLLLAGAWLDRVGTDRNTMPAGPTGDRDTRTGAVELSGTATATAATGSPITNQPPKPAPPVEAAVPPREPVAPDSNAGIPAGDTVIDRLDAALDVVPDAPVEVAEPVVLAESPAVPVPAEESASAGPTDETPTASAQHPIALEEPTQAARHEALQADLVARPDESARSVDEAAPKPEPAEAARNAPAPEERLALARPEPEALPRYPIQRQTAPASTVSVSPGDTLQGLADRRYGRSNLTTLDMLRVVNPDIRDVDLIIAGSGLEFPDPGPESRVLPDGSGFTVLALTTQMLSRALAVQSSLEDRLDRPVALERVATRGGTSIFRVSVRGLSDESAAGEIAMGLGPILQDPEP